MFRERQGHGLQGRIENVDLIYFLIGYEPDAPAECFFPDDSFRFQQLLLAELLAVCKNADGKVRWQNHCGGRNRACQRAASRFIGTAYYPGGVKRE